MKNLLAIGLSVAACWLADAQGDAHGASGLTAGASSATQSSAIPTPPQAGITPPIPYLRPHFVTSFSWLA